MTQQKLTEATEIAKFWHFPVHSAIFSFFGCHPAHSGVIPVRSGIFRFIPVYSVPFRSVPVFSNARFFAVFIIVIFLIYVVHFLFRKKKARASSVCKRFLFPESNDPPKVVTPTLKAANSESNEGRYYRNSTVYNSHVYLTIIP